MDVLSLQDGRTRIQGQTNISSATAADKESRDGGEHGGPNGLQCHSTTHVAL